MLESATTRVSRPVPPPTIAEISSIHLSPSEDIPIPIGTFPNELLDLIFEFAAFKKFILFDSDGVFTLATVFVMSHVCQAWRQRINSSPALWTHLVVRFSQETRDNMPPPPAVIASRTEYLEHVLNMSGALPSSLQLLVTDDLEETWDSTVFLAPVMAHVGRWLDLNLDMRLFPFFPPQMSTLPILRSLTMISLCRLEEDVDGLLLQSFLRCIRRAPNLRSFNLSGPGYEELFSDGPWTQLHSLTGVAHLCWLASISPSLRELRVLSILSWSYRLRWDFVDVPMEFPSLASFSVLDAEETSFDKLLSLFTLPSLRTLCIHLDCTRSLPSSVLLAALQGLIHRSSSPCIREFEMARVPKDDKDDTLAPSLLALFPNLECLRWGKLGIHDSSPYSQSLLKFLSETTPSTVSETPDNRSLQLEHLPLLRSLTLAWIMEPSENMLLNALEARTDPKLSSLALQHIEILILSKRIRCDLKRWETLKRRGVIITVRHMKLVDRRLMTKTSLLL